MLFMVFLKRKFFLGNRLQKYKKTNIFFAFPYDGDYFFYK